jgi:hypothetical protein
MNPMDESTSLQTSTGVMRPGDTLPADVMHALSTTVATTAARERLRKRTTLVLGVVGALAGAGAVQASGALTVAPFALVAAVCLLPVLPLHLAWGVRNRALLNAAARDAAVSPQVLVEAVRAVAKQAQGPSTALQVALHKERGRKD